jgi:hypothetical protein
MNPASSGSPPLRSIMTRLMTFISIFTVGLVTTHFFAYLPLLPRFVSNFFFFWPQTALAPYGFTSPMDDMTRTHLGGGANYAIAIAFWLVVGTALAWILDGKTVRATALATLPVSYLVGFAAETLLNLADIGIYYDGP